MSKALYLNDVMAKRETKHIKWMQIVRNIFFMQVFIVCTVLPIKIGIMNSVNLSPERRYSTA